MMTLQAKLHGFLSAALWGSADAPAAEDGIGLDHSLRREIIDAACCGMGCHGFGLEPWLDHYEKRVER
ncbi:MAG: hypothetical protein AAGA87_05160 [Pseudomonadota bacterium]